MSNKKDLSALLTVRDAAERLQVTPRTLKYYEERGLVTPSRSEGRYRLYDDEDIERFARILRLRSLGFSLHGITEMLKRPMEPTGDGRNRYSLQSLKEIGMALAQQVEALDARIAAVRRELKEAQTVRAELMEDLDYVQRRLAGENADALIDERLAQTRRRREMQRKTGASGSAPASVPASASTPASAPRRKRNLKQGSEEPS